jgi:hypothetical protein
MAPGDLLRPLDGQRAETLQLIDSLSEDQLPTVVEGDGRTVGQILCHLVRREVGVTFVIEAALAGELLHLDQEAKEQLDVTEHEPAAGWDLVRIRRELVEARQALHATFAKMTDEDLDRAIRWPMWPARTIRGSIPYMLEHEDSHLDDLRATIQGESSAHA